MGPGRGRQAWQRTGGRAQSSPWTAPANARPCPPLHTETGSIAVLRGLFMTLCAAKHRLQTASGPGEFGLAA